MSSAGISFGGLASGLDTKAIIAALMNVEQQPINALQARRANLSTQKGLFGDLGTLLSTLQEESGDIAGAVKSLEGSMYVRPLELAGHDKLGTLLLKLKQFPEAEREYQTLIALNTTDRAGAYYHLAEAFYGDGKKAEAYKNVMESLKIAPSYDPALALLLKTK